MDKWVTISKPSAIGRAANIKECTKNKNKYNPYSVKDHGKKLRNRNSVENILTPPTKDGGKPSSSAITKHLLNTLSDESNPITNSDICDRTDHVVSVATGHQRPEMTNSHRRGYHEHRTEKLSEQIVMSDSHILKGVRAYINGYLRDTTDIEMKRVISLAGGTTLRTPASATHIITSQQLSGSKTHKLLNANLKGRVHVIKPEWVTASISAGKRQRETDYTILEVRSSRSIVDYFQVGGSD